MIVSDEKIKLLERDLQNTTEVLGFLIAYLGRELGTENAEILLNNLHRYHIGDTPTTQPDGEIDE